MAFGYVFNDIFEFVYDEEFKKSQGNREKKQNFARGILTICESPGRTCEALNTKYLQTPFLQEMTFYQGAKSRKRKKNKERNIK